MENETIGKASKKRTNKLLIIGALGAAVIVLGAGFYAWHDTPGFCNSICHTPMDAYYDTYADGSHDKYGNALTAAESDTMLSHAHSKYMGGLSCMDCHIPTLSEQVGEATGWITGGYAIAGANSLGSAVLESRTMADLTEARGANEQEFCLNDRCHVTTPDRASLFEKTKALESQYNPHSDRHGDIDCGTCHKGHTQSVNYCTECHASAPVPDGWLTMQEATDLGIVHSRS